MSSLVVTLGFVRAMEGGVVVRSRAEKVSMMLEVAQNSMWTHAQAQFLNLAFI